MTLITFQDGKPVMRDGKVGTGSACCCGGSGCCGRPCCGVYVGWSINCNNDVVDGYQAVTWPANSCVSNHVAFEALCCVGNFQCPMAVRVRATCTGRNDALNCAVGCTYVLEYGKLLPNGNIGDWSTTLTYLTPSGNCNCNGTVLTVDVEERLTDDCVGGEPESTSPCTNEFP